MPNWKKVIVSGSDAHLKEVSSSGGISLGDDVFLNLGDSSDLQLYHDGSNSYIKDNGTGTIFYRSGTQTFQNAAGSKTMAIFNAANSVDLNYNNNTKFQTTNTGVSVTGNVVASGNVSGSSTSTGSFGAYGTNFIPVGDNALDLGSSGNEWKDLYVDGTAYLDAIQLPHEGKIDFGGGDGIIEANGNNNQIYLSRIASGGNVGIYQTNPQSRLDINGDLNVNTHITASGNISASGTAHTFGGTVTATSLEGTLTTAAQGNVTSLGTLTTLTVDDITLNGSTISDSGDLTMDIGGDLVIDVDGTDIILKDGGTAFGRFKRDSSDFIIKSEANNEDIILRGQDGGSTIDALLLDMSEAGSALFNSDISGSTIRASGDIIAFNSSDERLKDNVEPIKFPLDKLGKIGGYTFDWNNKQQIYHGHDVGVLAQEIEEVLPEAVKDRGSGYKGVQYDKIIPLLIEGIKELKEKVKHIEENCDCLKK